MRSRARILITIPLLLVAAACGGSDDAASDGDGPVDTTPAAPVETDASDSAGGDATGGVVMPTMPEGLETGGDGTATLTLENGESYEFDGVMCVLEPQMVAGSEILFTATSYGDPSLDVAQFGDGVLQDIATIDVYDASYQTLWEAFSVGGAGVDVSVDGNTIGGSAEFYDGAEELTEPVHGELLVDC